jgi:hypothetical protein
MIDYQQWTRPSVAAAEGRLDRGLPCCLSVASEQSLRRGSQLSLFLWVTHRKTFLILNSAPEAHPTGKQMPEGKQRVIEGAGTQRGGRWWPPGPFRSLEPCGT